MRLEDFRIRLRPRPHREALDLGLALLQAEWRAVYAAWFAVTLPVFLVLNLLLVREPLIATLIFWWLKPLYDRVVLHVLAQALFGNPPGLAETLRALPRLLRGTGLLAQLTLWRFSPQRSLVLPVLQLEGLKGRARRERIRVLGQRVGGHAFWLLFLCVNVETLFTVAQHMAVIMFLPEGPAGAYAERLFAENPPWWLSLLGNTFYFIAMSAVEPWYVASGFMLYINRRNELEAWDVELGLRRLARRLAAPVAAVLCLFALLPAPPAAAEPLPPSEAPRVIREVLDHPDFATEQTVTIWVPKNWTWSGDEEPDEPRFPGLPLLLADGMKLLLVGLLLWGLFLLYRHRERLGLVIDPRPTDPPPPENLFGLDLAPESLPDDVPGRARELWQGGEPRAALGLLYRAALSRLVNDAGVPLHEAMTEGDVLAAVGEANLPIATVDGLRRLTGAWQRIAWAHRPPPAAEMAALLDGWSGWFDGLGDSGAPETTAS